MKKSFKLLLISIFILNSCGSGLKDALEGKRRSKTGDEFFIQKKNPLSLPPNFGELPIPTEEEYVVNETNNDEIMKILNKNNSNNETAETSEIEDLILEEINKN